LREEKNLGENTLGTSGHNLLELVIDDLPLGIDDSLILADFVNPDFSIVPLGLELQLDVEANDLRILEFLGGKGKFFDVKICSRASN